MSKQRNKIARKTRETVPTPAGRILYREWRRCYREWQEGYTAAHVAQLGYIRSLRIGSVDMGQGMQFHIKLMDWLEQKYPEYTVEIRYGRADVLRDDLIAGKLDLLFVNALETAHLRKAGIHTRVFSSRPCKLCIQNWHPLFSREEITEKDLRGLPVTFFGSPEILEEDSLRAFCRRYGLQEENLQIQPDFKSAVVSAARETGLLFLEDVFGERRRQDVRCVPIREVSSGIAAAWADDRIRFLIPGIKESAGTLRKYRESGNEGPNG